MSNDNTELIQRILEGDDAAFACLVKKYQKRVHALAWRKIGDFHIAEDITQETFLQVYRNLAKLKDRSQFPGWLYVIANRRCLAWLRKKRVQTQPLEEMDIAMTERSSYSRHVAAEQAENAAETKRELVKNLLAKLKESDRTVLTLYYFGEMTYAEISEFLGVSVNTVATRVHRARERLKQYEPMIREALGSFQLSPDLTENIMREISHIKPLPPTGGKPPIVPWAIATSTAILVVMMLSVSNQYLSRFQQPYSFDANSEMTVEIIDASIVLDLRSKPDVRNQFGNIDGTNKRSSTGMKLNDILESHFNAIGGLARLSKIQNVQRSGDTQLTKWDRQPVNEWGRVEMAAIIGKKSYYGGVLLPNSYEIFIGDGVLLEGDIRQFHYGFQQAEGYLQARYDPLSFLSVALGVRFDYLNLTQELSIQPRGSISLTLPTTSTLRFAYGRYEQSPFAYQVLKLDGNRNLKSSIAEHYVAELEHALSPQTELKFALYYKDMEKLITRSINVDALFDDSGTVLTTPYLNQGIGFVNGAEVFLRHRVSEKFFGWFSYAYTHAERRDTPDASYNPFLFDNTHIVSLVANYNPRPKVSIGTKWQYVSGTSAVPLSTLLMIQDPVTLGMHPLLSDVAGAIAPAGFQAYHRLDLRLSRKRTQWGIPVTEFIEVWNVYNSENKINFSFPDKLVTESKKVDSEELPLDLETSDYRSPVRFPFNFTFGATYKF